MVEDSYSVEDTYTPTLRLRLSPSPQGEGQHVVATRGARAHEGKYEVGISTTDGLTIIELKKFFEKMWKASTRLRRPRTASKTAD